MHNINYMATLFIQYSNNLVSMSIITFHWFNLIIFIEVSHNLSSRGSKMISLKVDMIKED